MSKKHTSEFGRGYATSLIQFTFHRSRLARDEKLYAKMASKVGSDGLFTPNGAAQLWMNGASDHLYQLIRPRRGLRTASWRLARTLADRALDIGHGYRDSSASSLEECRRLLDVADQLLAEIGVTTFDEAITWDTRSGLRPDAGEWSCRVPMKAEDE